MQTIVRGETKFRNAESNGIPKTSNVARSNSLRSSSPPRYRRQQFNVPPSLPEGEVLVMPPAAHNQYPPAYNNSGRRLEHHNQFVSVFIWFTSLDSCILVSSVFATFIYN